MGDHHQLRRTVVNNGVPGDVDHTQALSSDIGALFLNDEYSDCVLIVEGRSFPVHKVILAARSNYFRAMLFGGMRESGQDEIRLKEVSAAAFSLLLRYIYTAKVQFNDVCEETLFSLLGTAHTYGFCELTAAISEYLRAALNLKNACSVFDMAYFYELTTLLATCYEFLDKHACEILQSDAVVELREESLHSLLLRDSFYAGEADIFRAVERWVKYRVSNDRSMDAESSKSNEGAEIGEDDDGILSETATQTNTEESVSRRFRRLVSAVRLPLMTMTELLEIVRPSNLFTGDELLDAIKAQHERDRAALRYRGVLLANGENVASTRFGAQVQRGECRGSLLSGTNAGGSNAGHAQSASASASASAGNQNAGPQAVSQNGNESMHQYDMERGFTRHAIDAPEQCIVVRLGQPSIINTLRMLLWDRDLRSYSYFVEVSIDDNEYQRVVDYRAYYCRSWQTLHFSPRVVRFIKVVGTHNTVNRVFHLVAFEAMYLSTPVDLVGDIMVPNTNVAHVSMSACVIEGVSRTRNALINGDTTHYDWDSGYTCHQLGHGSIVVQLAQPFMLSSMRLLLWDCDDRFYHYMIETSVDQRDWQLVADRRQLPSKSWQIITFERRPVVFVRITGTYNSANEVFHAVHFEAPCDPAALQQYLTDQQNAMLIATHKQLGSAALIQPQAQPQLQVQQQPSILPSEAIGAGRGASATAAAAGLNLVPLTVIGQGAQGDAISVAIAKPASNPTPPNSARQLEPAASSSNAHHCSSLTNSSAPSTSASRLVNSLAAPVSATIATPAGTMAEGGSGNGNPNQMNVAFNDCLSPFFDASTWQDPDAEASEFQGVSAEPLQEYYNDVNLEELQYASGLATREMPDRDHDHDQA